MNSPTTVLLVLAVAAVVVVLGLLASAKAEAARARSEAQRLAVENKMLATEMASRVHAHVQQWQETEMAGIRQTEADVARRVAEASSAEWKLSEEKRLRADAARRSLSVTVGKVTEQFMPYLPEFRFNPKDARFIGMPIDFVVFDGLDAGELKQLVIVEVKTGKSALTKEQKQVRDAIQSNRVVWEEIRYQPPSPMGTPQPPTASESPICQTCGDVATEVSFFDAQNKRFITLGCGHLVIRDLPKATSDTQRLPAGQLIVRVPDLGEGPTQECVVTRWYVPEESKVSKDQPLVELESDLLNIEVPSPVTGVVAKWLAAEGVTVRVGDPLAVIVVETSAAAAT